MPAKIIITTDRLPHAKLRPNNAPRSKSGAALRSEIAAEERGYINGLIEETYEQTLQQNIINLKVWFKDFVGFHSSRLPFTKATITYEWWNPRQIDWDNFLASCKPWQDALQDVGFIKDDKGLSGTVLPWQKGPAKVVIVLEETP